MADNTPRLLTPRLHVTLADGRAYEVQALNPDLLAWDRTAAQHHWPQGNVAPWLWMTFLAYKASLRTGQIDAGTTWDRFSETDAVEVRAIDNDDADAGVANGYADPTLLAVEPA